MFTFYKASNITNSMHSANDTDNNTSMKHKLSSQLQQENRAETDVDNQVSIQSEELS